MGDVFRGRGVVHGLSKWIEWDDSVIGHLNRWLEDADEATILATYRVLRPQRSLPQNRYYRGVIVPILADHCGYTPEEMHQELGLKLLPEEKEVLGLDGNRYTIHSRRSTTTLDTKEFAEYIDACLRIAFELGVSIPEPGEPLAHQIAEENR